MQGLKFGVESFGLRVWGLSFGVSGFTFTILRASGHTLSGTGASTKNAEMGTGSFGRY